MFTPEHETQGREQSKSGREGRPIQLIILSWMVSNETFPEQCDQQEPQRHKCEQRYVEGC